MRELALGVALACAVNAGARALVAVASRGVPLRLSPETAVQTAGLMSLGMRRMAADLELIRLLVYYGSREPGQEEIEDEAEKGGFDPLHPDRFWGGGHYPEIGPRARRILELDPSFSYPVLYGAGALAFNLNRPGEALALLEEALKREPKNNEYRAYLGAIGFHKQGDVERVLALLAPTLSQPDCPTMVKSMVAYMYKRAGKRSEAIRIYHDILATTRDAGYRATAERMLQELGARP